MKKLGKYLVFVECLGKHYIYPCNTKEEAENKKEEFEKIWDAVVVMAV